MSNNPHPENHLHQEAKRLLSPFQIHESNKLEVWQAFQASPDGVERCALAAKAIAQREGRGGAGLLLTMIRRGDHLLEPDPDTKRPTGWRYVRGTHSGTFVPDPAGTDPLPPGYDFTTRTVRGEREAEDTEHTAEQRDEIASLLRGWVADRFGIGNASDNLAEPTADLPERDPGRCDDCTEESRRRWQLGRFTICGACVLARKRAGLKVGQLANVTPSDTATVTDAA